MTNREYMINMLNDPFFVDDGCASYEAMVHYHVACPYFNGDKRCHCDGYSISREFCYRCKEEWLDSEVDE